MGIIFGLTPEVLMKHTSITIMGYFQKCFSLTGTAKDMGTQ